MRPDLNLEPPQSRSRNLSGNDGTPIASARPTTFFLTRDADLFASSNCSSSTCDVDTHPLRTNKEGPEGGTLSARASPKWHSEQDRGMNARRRSTIKPRKAGDSGFLDIQRRSSSSSVTFDKTESTLDVSRSGNSQHSPLSTASLTSQQPDSECCSDEISSQAMASSGDEHEELSTEIHNSAPQLVMPSIKMPSRRPFTMRGKQLGRFRILVTGSQGCGKTSLIKSIVQLCEDIVHVDPSTSFPFEHKAFTGRGICHYSEIFASTKPYPEWWSEIDESRILKRKRKIGNSVLERNLCFVDTVSSSSIDNTLFYIEQQFLRSINIIQQLDNELGHLMSGRGGSQVDLVLYLVTKETLKTDIEQMKRLAELTSVVPLLAKSDLVPDSCLAELVAAFNADRFALPKLPVFGNDQTCPTRAPYKVSSANGPDFDTIDASLLMSPEYVQPLVPSELSILIGQIFDPAVASFLRHSSAKKLVTWYAKKPKLTKPLTPSMRSVSPSSLASPAMTSLAHSGVLIPVRSDLSLDTSNNYALAKVLDHTRREEHLAQIRLCKWASELQLSLQRERERYENVARNERAAWLVQRMGEEIRDGQLVPFFANNPRSDLNEAEGMLKHHVFYPASIKHDLHDPLGLLRWQEIARGRGWIMLQAIGSFGVVSGIALWLAKHWGFATSWNKWTQERSTQ